MRRLDSEKPAGVPVTVDFEGHSVLAFEGEPVACALLAADKKIFSRSIKYHRPRGPFCMTGSCSQCLMRVDGTPNLFTCQTPARAGMRLERQNAYPSAQLDIFASIDWLFPNGLDHHEMFAGVPVAQTVMQKVARQLAGLGVLPDKAPPPRAPAGTLRTPVAVVGAGLAGMAAARTLQRLGIPFALFERDVGLGGRALWGAATLGHEVATPETFPADCLHTRCTALGLYEDEGGKFLLVADERAEAPRLMRIYADRFLLTTGGHASLLPFLNNDLPGVYSAQALGRFVRRHRMLPAETIALVGHGPELYATGELLQSAGARVVAQVDVEEAPPPGSPEGSVHGTVVKAHGLNQVKGMTFLRAGEPRKVKVACEAIGICLPASPAFELARQGGARVTFDVQLGAFVVEADADGKTSNAQVYVAGEVCGWTDEESITGSAARAVQALATTLPSPPAPLPGAAR